jgi:hypothetical protein
MITNKGTAAAYRELANVEKATGLLAGIRL